MSRCQACQKLDVDAVKSHLATLPDRDVFYRAVDCRLLDKEDLLKILGEFVYEERARHERMWK